MAHPEQQTYCAAVKARFPDRFVGGYVLDIGSLDINGSNRTLFHGAHYIGLDLGPGKGVDIVCHAREYDPRKLRPDTGSFEFDVVISTEALEHDKHWRETLAKMLTLCRPGGLIVLTCATTGRPEHGTSEIHGFTSPFTNDYYGNLTEEDVRSVWDCAASFSEHEFATNPRAHDLYFWGVKLEDPCEAC